MKPFCINETCENFLPEDQRGYYKKKTTENVPGEPEGEIVQEEKKTAKKSTAKKTTEKKTAEKKTAAKKSTTKKTTTKKTTAKKKESDA